MMYLWLPVAIYNSGTAREFMCVTGESVALSALCDGIADCSHGNDETSPICESKHCLIML